MIEILLLELGIKIMISIERLPPTPPASAASLFPGKEVSHEQRKTA